MTKQSTIIKVLSMLFIGTHISLAVVVSGGDGTQNTTAPVGDQGWSYVGRISSKPSSVTYVSNNWFITAHHIKQLDNPTAVILNGTTYNIDSSSWTRVTNVVSGTDADLEMFRVTTSVSDVSGTSIVSSRLSNGTDVTMIGNGYNREATETSWDRSWVEGGTPTRYRGYKWGSAFGTSKRWGSNTIEGSQSAVDDGYGVTDVLFTDFDNVDGEAQGATYDSGGGVFANNKLAGIMLFVGTYSTNQPNYTAVYGNQTYMADLSSYSTQINNTIAIPEPAVISIFLLIGGGVWFVRRIFVI